MSDKRAIRSKGWSTSLVGVALLVCIPSCEGEKRLYTPPDDAVFSALPGPSGAAQPPGSSGNGDAGAPCREAEIERCGPAASQGICRFGSRQCVEGEWSDCEGAVYPAQRDCTSESDNDCDGQPDNLIDDTCRCVEGSVEPCDTHPGQDGVGACRAGERHCVIAADRRTSDWGACEGAIGPAAADSCAMAGDDADCNGTPNSGCPCVDGTTRPCGPNSDAGRCEFGVSTCVNEVWTGCVGAILPGARDCSSTEDNDCNGLPDDSVDSVCTCAVGDVQVCGEHPGQDGRGRCQAGSRSCELGLNGTSSRFGACTGSIAPLAADRCTVRGDDANCDGVANGGCECIAGDRTTCGQLYGSLGVCSARTLTCSSDGRWPGAGSCAASGPEICSNNLDDDCDGQVNEVDACAQCTPGESVCVDPHTANVCSANGILSAQICDVVCARGHCVDPTRDASLVGCDNASGVVCDRGAEQCCQADGVAPPGVCRSAAASCPTRFIQCDDPSDCPGRVCCQVNNSAVQSLTCRNATDCVQPPPTIPPGRFNQIRIVCNPTAPSCPPGAQCLRSSLNFVDATFFTCVPPGESP